MATPGTEAHTQRLSYAHVARMLGIAIGFALIVSLCQYFANDYESPNGLLGIKGVGFFLTDLGFYAAAAYIYALLRLPRATWRRTALEAFALLIVAAVLSVLISSLIFDPPSFLRRTPDLAQFVVRHTLPDGGSSSLIGAPLGTAVAYWSIPWSGVRSRSAPAGVWHMIAQATCVLIGFLAVWLIAFNIGIYGLPFLFNLRGFFNLQLTYQTSLFLRALGADILIYGPAVASLAVAVIQALRLKRLT